MLGFKDNSEMFTFKNNTSMAEILFKHKEGRDDETIAFLIALFF